MKNNQKILIFVVLCSMSYVLLTICKYWYADYLYNYGKNYNSSQKPDVALSYLLTAVKLQPNQALYHNEIAISYTLLKDDKNADSEIQKALQLEPNNINIIRSSFGIYIRLSDTKVEYVQKAKNALDNALLMAPNDPKLFYNLGLMYARAGQNEEAKKILNKALDLKPDYGDPKKALDLI